MSVPQSARLWPRLACGLGRKPGGLYPGSPHLGALTPHLPVAVSSPISMHKAVSNAACFPRPGEGVGPVTVVPQHGLQRARTTTARSLRGPHGTGNRWSLVGTNGHGRHSGIAGNSARPRQTSGSGAARRRVRIPRDLCRGPAALANDAGVTGVEPHLAVELAPTLPGPMNVVLAGRATSVPFTTVLTGPQRTTTDKAPAPSTCVIPSPRR